MAKLLEIAIQNGRYDLAAHALVLTLAEETAALNSGRRVEESEAETTEKPRRSAGQPKRS